MYTKTKSLGLAVAFALLLGTLTIATPQNAYAALEQGSTAQVEFKAGELSLVKVAEFDFGAQDIASGTNHYNATSVGDDIQVSDLRGNGKGWDLNVSLSELTNTTNGKPLAGAYVTLSGTKIAGVDDTDESVVTAPTSPSTASLQINSDGEETLIFTADTNAGLGVWGITTELTDATLTVLPGTAYVGDYEADLTWTLQSTP